MLANRKVTCSLHIGFGIVTVLMLMVLLPGCALLDTSAGRAKYSIQPVLFENAEGGQSAACCQITIYNSKDIENIMVEGRYNPETGLIEFKLDQAGVVASEPMARALENQKAISETLTEVLKVVNKIPIP